MININNEHKKFYIGFYMGKQTFGNLVKKIL